LAIIHRNGDTRACGAATIASQSKLTFGGQAAALQGDVESHSGGAFNNSGRPITYQGKTLIAVGDSAAADVPLHNNTQAATGFAKVTTS
jgi:uncharacterized Zn-binding protein involved in type VI secretion